MIEVVDYLYCLNNSLRVISFFFFLTHWLSDLIQFFVLSKMHSDIMYDLNTYRLYCLKYAASLYQKVRILKIFHWDVTYMWCVELCSIDMGILYKAT